MYFKAVHDAVIAGSELCAKSALLGSINFFFKYL